MKSDKTSGPLPEIEGPTPFPKAMPEKSNEDEILAEARKRFQLAHDADSESRDEALDDLRFINGDQWPEEVKKERIEELRPCITVNRLPGFIDQVVGDQRQNRPGIKVRAFDSYSDPEKAEIFEGIIRNIESISDAETIYDNSFETGTSCGRGFFRVLTEYSGDDSFDQDIKIKRIANPFSVYWDPSAQEIDLSDAKWQFIVDKISREDFEEAFPGKAVIDFEEATGDMQSWVWEDSVRIAEYWRKTPVEKTIYQLDDGNVVDEIIKDMEVIRERTVKTHKIEWMLISGNEILAGPNVWAGKYIPIIPVWGKEINVDGKRILRGLIRFAKDPQRMYNYSRTASTEVMSNAPRVPYMVTAKQIEGYENIWNMVHKKNLPYLLYNPDPQNRGAAPKRETPATIPTGIIQEIKLTSDEMKQTTGIFEASLGEKSNETSGRAILARQREGDTATFAYIDNLARAQRYLGKILIDLIPKIYDTEQIVRVLGLDGSSKFMPINYTTDPDTGDALDEIMNDLSVGRYDVTVTVGPSYNTQRMEASDTMMKFVQSFPDAVPVIGDLIAKAMDWPDSDEIAERLKALLPPEIKETISQEGKEIPEEGVVEQPMPEQMQEEQQPNPVEVLQVEQEAAKLEGLEIENRKKEVEEKILIKKLVSGE